MALEKFHHQKLAYAKKLIKEAKRASNGTREGYEQELKAINKAMDYCEKWARYFPEESKMHVLLNECCKYRTGTLSMLKLKEKDATRNWQQIQDTKKIYKELGLAYY